MIKNLLLISSIIFSSPLTGLSLNNTNNSTFKETKLLEQPATLEELRATDPLEIATLDKYDSRKYDIVTYPKLQVENICWSFATMGASETSIAREGLFYSDTRHLYLNERNHAFNVFNNDPNLDPLNLTQGDAFSTSTIDSGNDMYGSGKRMLTWTTPSIEDRFDSSLGYKPPDFLLEDIIRVDPSDRNDIKRAISRYGAVTVVYHITDYHRNYYYYNGNVNVFDGDDHAVTIVGWDDTIDKNKYTGKPSTLDGGWIVKNSWGGAHAEGDGYFIMSYDTPIKDIYAYDFASKDKYDYNYHYDSFVKRDDFRSDNGPIAAIFPVKKSSLTKEEYLKAINVSILDTEKVKSVGEGEIIGHIYKNVTANESDIYSLINNPINEEGLVATVSRKINHEGSYTLELPQEIELEKGTYFSVVVEIKSPNDKYRVALSKEGNTSINDLTFYKDENGKWINCGSTNLRYVARIKAFTKTKDRTEIIGNDLKYTTIDINENVKPRYNEISEKIPLTISNDGKILKEGIDYKLEPIKVTKLPGLTETTSDNDVVATGTIKAIGIGEWTGENVASFPILVGKHDLSSFGEILPDGKIKITVDGSHVTYGDILLPKNWKFAFPDYKLEVGDNEGNYLNYVGDDEVCYRRNSFDVILTKTSDIPEKIDINNANIKLIENEFVYDSNEHCPEVYITYNDQKLVIGTDYLLEYKNNVNAGQGEILLNGIGKYKGQKIINFNINKASLNDVEVNYDSQFEYDGNPKKPLAKLIFKNNELKENVDYIVTFKDNIDAGTGTITFEGINNFEGTLIKSFNINKAKNKIIKFEVINGNPTAKSLFGEVDFKYFKDEKCLIEIPKPEEEGVYYVKAVVHETLNYEGAISEPIKFEIKSDVKPEPPIEPEPPIDPEEPTPPTTPEDEESGDNNKMTTGMIVAISSIVSIVCLLSGLGIYFFIKGRKKN